MHKIGKGRFDALAGYARRPMASEISREFAWFETDDTRAVAALFVDTDGEFAAVLMAPDLQERYRAIYITGFHDDAASAQSELEWYAATQLTDFEERRRQGDETGRPVDFFTPVVADSKLDGHFRMLATGDGFGAARDLISSMMRWHEDVDGNFIEQFQSTGFNARIWELYLFAALTESNLDITRPAPAPDFLAHSSHGNVAIEATTINPSVVDGQPTESVRPAPGEDDTAYRHHYLPIRYAGPLIAKFAKRYWERSEVAGKPFVIAIQDFHDTMSMTYSGSALPEYLYGLRHDTRREADGRLIITPVPVTEHQWGTKVIPSGFFNMPDAQNVSAVVSNSLGTISKFNRMGVQAGFGRERVALIHSRVVADLDPGASEPRPFTELVSEDSTETWGDGMDVFHNPNALHPLNVEVLPYAAHHRVLTDGQLVTIASRPPVISSRTAVVVAK